MTIEEKLAQVGCVWSSSLIGATGQFDPALAVQPLSAGIGQVTRIGGATVLGPRESAQVANAIQRFLVERTRLGIPAIIHEESCAGYLARDATCFPQAIGLASTWEPELIEKMTAVIRLQMRAVGAHQALAPVLDVARDPRWGRTEETFGEDPYLISQIGVAYVRGLQGSDLSSGIIATGKHFLGYGASEGGMNWAPAHIPRRELLDVYALPFEAAIKTAALRSIMNAYNEIDGVPLGASREHLVDLLRDQLGFHGLVVTDYFTLATLASYHHVAEDKSEAARLGMEAGLDVELPAISCYGEPLHAAISDGRVPVQLLDKAVRRVLASKLELGLFENPYVDDASAPLVFDTAEHRQLAGDIARQSLILLKNEAGLLPLRKDLSSLAVIGPCADSVRLLQGDYHYPAHLEIMFGDNSGAGLSPRPEASIDLTEHFVEMVTVAAGIRTKLGAEAKIRVVPGCGILEPIEGGIEAAVEAARAAEVAIVVVGGKSGLVVDCTSGESRDRADLGLPGRQQELVERVVGAGGPVVVVLVNGRPLALPWIAEHVPAIVEAWLPGEEGGTAIADVLFGDVCPGGKLPISIPVDVGQVPVYYNHKPSGGRSQWHGDYVDMSSQPLFPFGHGLSYTSFEYSGVSITPNQARAHETVGIRVDVRNTGAVRGEEVVQLYTHDRVGSVTRPVKELKGFHRIRLAPGERKSVTFHLAINQLGFHDRDRRFVVEPGAVDVLVGSSSADIRASGPLEITGQRTDVSAAKVFCCRVTVG
jgi:beta-glucosidase